LKQEIHVLKAVDTTGDENIEKLKKENTKLDNEARMARKENMVLKQRLGTDEHRKEISTSIRLQMDAEKEKALENEARLKNDIDRLKTRVLELETGNVGQMAQTVRATNEQNATLRRQVEELMQMKTRGVYDTLVEVAKLMGEVNRSSDGETGNELKIKTFELVDRSLAGNGMTSAQISERRQPIYAGFFAAYSKATRNEQESYVQRIGCSQITKKRK